MVVAVDRDVVSHENRLAIASWQLPVIPLRFIASPLYEPQSSSSKQRPAGSLQSRVNARRLRRRERPEPQRIRRQSPRPRSPLNPSEPQPPSSLRGDRGSQCPASRRENPDRLESAGTERYLF